MEGLELRVQVLLLVGGIGEGVETDTVLVVRSQVPQLDSVPSLDNIGWAQWDDLVLEALRADCDGSVVNHEVSDCECLGVYEKRLVALGEWSLEVEVDHSVSEIVVTFLQCKLEVIFNFLDNRFAPVSLFAGQDYSLFEFLVDDNSVAKVLSNEQLFLCRENVVF